MKLAGRLIGIWLGAALLSLPGYGVLLWASQPPIAAFVLTLMAGVGLGLWIEGRVSDRRFTWQAGTAGAIGAVTPPVVLFALLVLSCGGSACFS